MGIKKTSHSVCRSHAALVRLRRDVIGGLTLVAMQGCFAQAVDFHGALQAAEQGSPLLQARAASVQGTAALQTSAGRLPDPKLTLGIDSLPVNGANRGSLTRDDFTQRQIGLVQEVPNRAKRAARADMAAARTGREQALTQAEKLTVRREAGLAWIARYYAEKRLALFDAVLGHHRLLVETAPAQLAAGKISPAEVTTIKLETLALADQHNELQKEVEQSIALLKRWAGVGVTSLAGEPPALRVNSAYLRTHIERSPGIAVLMPTQAMAEAEVREAEAAKSGDWSWGVGYGKRGQGYGDLLSVQLTFELPLAPGERQQPQIRARQKEVERIAAEREDLVRQQTQELENLLAELDELNLKLNRLTKEAHPLAAQRSAFTLAAYESGRDKLGSVFEARKQQTELELRALALQAKQQALQWRLNTLIAE